MIPPILCGRDRSRASDRPIDLTSQNEFEIGQVPPFKSLPE
jgi:hypothetical protein